MNHDHLNRTPVSIVVLSHNRLDELSKNLLPILSGFAYPTEFQIIIVDNNSDDGSKAFLIDLQKKYSFIQLVLNDRNLGVGGGRNSGFTLAKRDYIVALDDDSHIEIEDLRRIPNLFEKYNNAGILAFRVVNPITREFQNQHGEIVCEIANHHGAGFAFRKVIYELTGGIDNACDFGAEELDFSIRTRVHGWSVLSIPDIVVLHNNLKRDPSLDRFRRIRRVYNNIRIYSKYFPKWMALRNGGRYLILAIRTWLPNYGIFSTNELLTAGFQGYKAGRLINRPIPKKVIVFYNDTRLRPEFGNVPIRNKIIRLVKNIGQHG